MMINFLIINQHLERLDYSCLTADSKNFIKAHFNFNDSWDGFVKTIHFVKGDDSYSVTLEDDSVCTIPTDVLTSGNFLITVIGEKDDVKITTNEVSITVKENVLANTNESVMYTDYDGETEYTLITNGETVINTENKRVASDITINVHFQDMMQKKIDITNSCANLFYNYNRSDVSYIASLDTSQVTTMESMFDNCYYITSVPLFDTSEVTSFEDMFNGCNKLVDIPKFNTPMLQSLYNTFVYCSSLEVIPAMNFGRVNTMYGTFGGCRKLKEIHAYGMKVDFNISASTLFTREALVEILNNLATVTSNKTLTMGATNLAKLTEEDKAIATNKGWTLV